VLFEDPDGIRLEMNHVPGQGLRHAQYIPDRYRAASSGHPYLSM